MTVELLGLSLDEGASLGRLFEAQVNRTPAAPAAVHGDTVLTYSELNGFANQIARRLSAVSSGQSLLVGLYVSRGVEAIAAVLGILKAGHAYVPLDPCDPAARTLSILKDAGITQVVTHSSISANLSGINLKLLELDANSAEIAAESTENLSIQVEPDSLAYVIYTSGTTGQPKGVTVEHASVIHLINALASTIYAPYSNALRVSQTANLSFDASVKQIFQLLKGHTLVVVPDDARRDGGKLLSFIQSHNIDIVDSTPSLIEILRISGLAETSFSNKPAFLIGGEPIPQTLWTALKNLKAFDFYNVYGPTECTVDATWANIHTASDQPTIGQPLPGVGVHIVDSALRPVPPSLAGEIVISGPGVARGYLNAPELTSEKFVHDPTGRRVYKTGDRARRTPDGNLQFIGRGDSQVKVRGYRVELGEIEHALNTYQGVQNAAATVLDDGRLAGYVVSATGGKFDDDALRSHLQTLVPEYMVPSVFVTLQQIPLSSNGKVDRRLLPIPPKAPTNTTTPSTDDPLELLLLSHWREALRVTDVDVDDDFFELGGNSIAATQMISNLQGFFPTEDPLLSLFFEDPTVAGLARGIRECKEEGSDPDEAARLLLQAATMTDDQLEAMLLDDKE